MDRIFQVKTAQLSSSSVFEVRIPKAFREKRYETAGKKKVNRPRNVI